MSVDFDGPNGLRERYPPSGGVPPLAKGKVTLRGSRKMR
jgi:hypothetical protein